MAGQDILEIARRAGREAEADGVGLMAWSWVCFFGGFKIFDHGNPSGEYSVNTVAQNNPKAQQRVSNQPARELCPIRWIF